MNDQQRKNTASGLWATLCAFTIWGLSPIYWKQLSHVPALEILCHRIVWSLVFVALVLTVQKRWPETMAALKSMSAMILLTASSLLIGANWYLYIWSVTNSHMVEASLGYYINPLVNVLLSFVFFREKPSRIGAVAIVLAAVGVGNQIYVFGQFPWIALTLALTFGFYGLVRKIVKIQAVPGLFFETLILTPVAGGYVVNLALNGTGALMAQSVSTDMLLVGAGVITSIPLMGFAHGARNLSLITVGIIQYLAPTCMFLLGVLAYEEPFSPSQLITFVFIWSAIVIYTADGIARNARTRKKRSG